MAANLRNNASLPLVGMVLACSADPDSRRLQRRLRRLRVLSLLAAVGFVMLIPRQTSAAMSQVWASLNAQLQVQQRLERTIRGVQAARSSQFLAEAIRRGLAAPQSFAIRDEQSLDQIRPRLVGLLRVRLTRLQAELRGEETLRLRKRRRDWLFQGLIAATYTFAFSSMADRLTVMLLFGLPPGSSSE